VVRGIFCSRKPQPAISSEELADYFREEFMDNVFDTKVEVRKGVGGVSLTVRYGDKWDWGKGKVEARRDGWG